MPTEKIDAVHSRSEEVQEILSHPPHWIIRWGITIIFLVIAMLLGLSWFIRYPDVIAARITVTTETPPVELVARTFGELRLHVSEGDTVEAGALLAELKNSADYGQVMRLKTTLERLSPNLYIADSIAAFRLDSLYKLGSLQPAYAAFAQSFQRYQFAAGHNAHLQKVSALSAQIRLYEALGQKLQNQKGILFEEMEIARVNFERNQDLVEKKALAVSDLKVSESVYLQKRYAYENTQISTLNNDIRIVELRKGIADLSSDFQRENRGDHAAMLESFSLLRSQIPAWEQEYLLVAPFKGKVSLNEYWSSTQFVRNGDVVVTLIPESSAYKCIVQVPGAGTGKVKVGQNVRIKFDSYPFREFGMVLGTVRAISNLARDNQVLVHVSLQDGLRSSIGKDLEFRQQMQGTAEIVTEDMRLLERFFIGLRGIFS